MNINNTKSNFLLYSGGGIINKKILNIDKKFIHIHPGYLPEMRGADCLLWSIKESGNIGATSFFMNDKIDNGAIMFREKFIFNNLKNDIILKKNQKDIYRFIYSFFDPIIRANHFLNYLLNCDYDKIQTIKNNSKYGKYYSFMNLKPRKIYLSQLI